MLKEFLQVRENREEALRNVKGRIYQKFDEHYADWLGVVKAVAELDCLVGLSLYKGSMGGECCRPEFVQSSKSFLEIEELRHPCLISEYVMFVTVLHDF
jgi:DNA mismatch repair protein MSH6